MALSDDERQILRQGKHFEDMVETAGWKDYVTILEYHLKAKRDQLDMPLLAVTEGPVVDAGTRLAMGESVKGAIIALKLALTIPPTTIEQAKEIRRSLGGTEETSQ